MLLVNLIQTVLHQLKFIIAKGKQLFLFSLLQYLQIHQYIKLILVFIISSPT